MVEPTELIANGVRNKRLLVEKAKWKGNADSPVCLTIDDFANAWYDANGNGVLEFGEDWGGGLDKPGSAINFLKTKLLEPFPEICITFFTVMGPISSFKETCPFTLSMAIDESVESEFFFRTLYHKKNIEIAFHGYDHGTPGNEVTPFKQEWEDVESAELSLEKIEKGTRIFNKVFGERPIGGKTGAYIMSRDIEKSINMYGFKWWCRDWMNKNVKKKNIHQLYEPKFFGDNKVIDIPSTVNGRVWYRRQINNLLKDRQIITVQEHISPYGPAGQYVRPNVFFDIISLQRLFKYLQKKKVWNATISEIAEYIDAYTYTQIFDPTKDSFEISYTGKLRNPIVTITIDPYCLRLNNSQGNLEITLPDGSTLSRQQYYYDEVEGLFLVDVPVQNGVYMVSLVENPVHELKADVGQDGGISYSKERYTGLLDIKIPSPEKGFLKYSNNGREFPLKYSNQNTISVFCINSNKNDRLTV